MASLLLMDLWPISDLKKNLVLPLCILFFGCQSAVKQPPKKVNIYKEVSNCQIDQIQRIAQQNPDLLHSRDQEGVTPLMVASIRGKTECVQYLISQGVSINDRDLRERNALFYAIEGRKLDSSLLLLKNRIDFDYKDNFNLTPLMIASKNNMPLLVREMITRKVNIHESDENGWNALFFAVVGNSFESVSLLVQAGIDIDRKDIEGKKASDIAYEDLAFKISDFLEMVSEKKDKKRGEKK